MLVYGDRIRREVPSGKLLGIVEMLRAVAAAPPGIERHGRLVRAFTEASELFQGVADAAFAVNGCDTDTPLQDRLMALLVEIARAVSTSWQSGFEVLPNLPLALAEAITGEGLPESIQVKTAEGYAFYALYPEAYAIATEAVAREGPTTVIGIRSIGAGLAAMATAVTGASMPATVRPVGPPFGRTLSLAPDLAARLTADPTQRFVVADEGPGLSGSSFGAVADALQQRDVPEERIVFLPSHAGDLGPQADPRHRSRWGRARRPVVEFDALVAGDRHPNHRLAHWIADLIGECDEPLRDISGGAWRTLRFEGESDWPAAHLQQERRKFLARTADGLWLVKFAGLGRAGPRKLARAQALAAAGFAPQIAGHRHGFLVERWRSDAALLDPPVFDRRELVGQVGRYLAFRAGEFPAEPGSGASLEELWAMARHNAGQALGAEASACFGERIGRVRALERRVRRVETDSRMHAWEWLCAPDGRLIKTDALDHHDAHDLVGCQDVAWDVAGAMIELDLSPAEAEDLCAVIERESGHPVDPELLAVLTPCYVAFQMGHHLLGAESLAGFPAEAARMRRAGWRYAARFGPVLDAVR